MLCDFTNFAVDCGVRQESIFLWRFSSPLFIYIQVYTKTTWCCMRNLPRHKIWSIIISDIKYWKWRKESTKARNKPRYNICSFIYFVFYIPSSLFRKINGVQTNFPEYKLHSCCISMFVPDFVNAHEVEEHLYFTLFFLREFLVTNV